MLFSSCILPAGNDRSSQDLLRKDRAPHSVPSGCQQKITWEISQPWQSLLLWRTSITGVGRACTFLPVVLLVLAVHAHILPVVLLVLAVRAHILPVVLLVLAVHAHILPVVLLVLAMRAHVLPILLAAGCRPCVHISSL